MLALDGVTCTILVVVFFAGLCGNVTVCLIFFRTRLFSTHKNSLHLSLAIADSISCSFNAPLGLVSVLKGEKLSDRHLLCNVLVAVFIIISTINLATLAAICILRTVVVLRPKSNISKKVTRFLIAGIWFSALGLSALNNTLFEDDYYAMCASVDNSEKLPNYGKTVGVTLVVISFLIIHSCYLVVLWKRYNDRTTKVKPVVIGLTSPDGCGITRTRLQLPNSAKDPMDLHSNMTSIHTTLILGAILFISYLPLSVLVFLPQEKVRDRASWFFFAFSVSLIMSMLNPYVYTLRCAAFQREVTSLAPCFSKFPETTTNYGRIG